MQVKRIGTDGIIFFLNYEAFRIYCKNHSFIVRLETRYCKGFHHCYTFIYSRGLIVC
jgi:hypothetical protein